MNPHQKNKVDVNVSSLHHPSAFTGLSTPLPSSYLSTTTTTDDRRRRCCTSHHVDLAPSVPSSPITLCLEFLASAALVNPAPQQSLSPEEQRLFRLYGKLPSRSDHFAKHLKDRKYFDSGDYAMSKAGKGDGVDTGSVGSQHPVPENIPHLSSPAGSPVKESSFLNRETSAEGQTSGDDPANDSDKPKNANVTESLAAAGDGIPIRR
ncbi:hypothetical protein G7046_g9062 [Stylonectria norvegica]|nr:hypothetical protein G7046_g9062 [Stylonectria norvegica]